MKKIKDVIKSRVETKVKYLVVGYDDNKDTVTFLSTTNRAFFKKSLIELMADDAWIESVWPEQSCFLGLMFGMKVDSDQFDAGGQQKYHKIMSKYRGYETSAKENITFDRRGNIVFCDNKSGEVRSVSAYEVAASRRFIGNFDATTACMIGIYVGSNLKRLESPITIPGRNKMYPRDKVVLKIVE